MDLFIAILWSWRLCPCSTDVHETKAQKKLNHLLKIQNKRNSSYMTAFVQSPWVFSSHPETLGRGKELIPPSPCFFLSLPTFPPPCVCVCKLCAHFSAWMWVFPCSAVYMWRRSEDNLGWCSSLSHFPSCPRQGLLLFATVYTRLATWKACSNSSIFIYHLNVVALKVQIYASLSSSTWVQGSKLSPHACVPSTLPTWAAIHQTHSLPFLKTPISDGPSGCTLCVERKRLLHLPTSVECSITLQG